MRPSFLSRLAWMLPLLAGLNAVAHDSPGEYFFGTDPGVGNATPLPLSDPAAALADISTLTLPLPSSFGTGQVLGLRFRNPAGDWGITQFSQIYLLSSATLASGRLYYAIDSRPNPATAGSVELTAAHQLAVTPLALDLGTLTPGFHSLHLLLRDSAGASTETLRFIHATPSTVQTLAGLAYSFREAEGTTTPVTVAPITTSTSAQDIVLAIPAATSPKQFTLVLNLVDAQLDTGRSTTAPLRVSVPYYEWAYAALAGQAPTAAAMLSDPDGDRIVNLLEFAFGLNPLIKNTTPPYTIGSATTESGSLYFTVNYRQREGGTGSLGVDYTADGLRYTVEASTDLQTWQPFSSLPGASSHRSRATNGDGTETINLELFLQDTLTANKKVFVRLNVTAVQE